MSAICRDTAWILERIAKKKALIGELEDQISALTTGGVDMYQLDTGQTRSYVQKQRLTSLQASLTQAEADRAALEAKLYGASVVGRPGF